MEKGCLEINQTSFFLPTDIPEQVRDFAALKLPTLFLLLLAAARQPSVKLGEMPMLLRILFVGPDDFFHQTVPHHIVGREFDDPDSLDSSQDIDGFSQPGRSVPGQIHL
jgi:hypothetical protein